MSEPTVFRLVDLSTGHLTAATRGWLLGDRALEGVPPATDLLSFVPWHEYGWFMYQPELSALEGLPADLVAALTYSHRHRADYVLFDCDAETSDDLPIYEDEP